MSAILLFQFLLPLMLTRQTLPVDATTGKFFYAEAVLVKDAPQTDLYNRAKGWFEEYQEGENIFLTDDRDQGILVVNATFNLPADKGNGKEKIVINYTFQLEMEDDRYWLRLHNFKFAFKNLANNGSYILNQEINSPLENLFPGSRGVEKKKEFYSELDLNILNKVMATVKGLKNAML